MGPESRMPLSQFEKECVHKVGETVYILEVDEDEKATILRDVVKSAEIGVVDDEHYTFIEYTLESHSGIFKEYVDDMISGFYQELFSTPEEAEKCARDNEVTSITREFESTEDNEEDSEEPLEFKYLY